CKVKFPRAPLLEMNQRLPQQSMHRPAHRLLTRPAIPVVGSMPAKRRNHARLNGSLNLCNEDFHVLAEISQDHLEFVAAPELHSRPCQSLCHQIVTTVEIFFPALDLDSVLCRFSDVLPK